MQSIQNDYPVAKEEFLELNNKFGQLCHYAAWQLKKKNSNNNHTDDQEDIAQDLQIALMRAASYYKRQTYIEDCLTLLSSSFGLFVEVDEDGEIHFKVTDKSDHNDKLIRSVIKELWDLWLNRTRHGANRQKFGKYQEAILDLLVKKFVKKVERPKKDASLLIDAKFVTYCKQIIWNQQKAIGKKITREKSWRNGMVSLSEYDYLVSAS